MYEARVYDLRRVLESHWTRARVVFELSKVPKSDWKRTVDTENEMQITTVVGVGGRPALNAELEAAHLRQEAICVTSLTRISVVSSPTRTIESSNALEHVSCGSPELSPSSLASYTRLNQSHTPTEAAHLRQERLRILVGFARVGGVRVSWRGRTISRVYWKATGTRARERL